MTDFSLRRRIGQDLRRHTHPKAAAAAIAQTLHEVSDGQVRPRQGWIQAQLVPMVDSAKDRAEGCMDWAALAISRDLAWTNPFQIVDLGLFEHDAAVMAWHAAETVRMQALGH